MRPKYLAGLIVAGIVGLIAPSAASAHNGAIQIGCTPTGASVVFNWQNFPRQFNVVNADVTLDTLTVPGSGKASFQGSSGSKTIPVTIPADGRPHTIVATTTWQQDNGGRAQRSATCTVPVPPPTPTPPTPVPPTPVPPTPVPPTPVPPTPPGCGFGTECCPVCVSGRQIPIKLAARLRSTVRTARQVVYTRVTSATMTFKRARPAVVAANLARTGRAYDPDPVRVTIPMRLVNGQFRATADYRNVLAVKGEVFHVSISAKVAGRSKPVPIGRSYRLCRSSDGDLNESSDQRVD